MSTDNHRQDGRAGRLAAQLRANLVRRKQRAGSATRIADDQRARTGDLDEGAAPAA